MNQQQKGILTLVRAAITGESLPLPADFSLEDAFVQITRHQIACLAFEGAVRCGISKQLPVMQQLFRSYCINLKMSQGQMRAIAALCEVFEEHQIDYLLMKGILLKQIYPKHELRRMHDADILIRDEQYPKIKKIVTALGYAEQEDTSDHTYTWQNEDLYMELHKRPIPKETKDLYGYFGDGWSQAYCVQGHRYAWPLEDEYIYVFTHYAKHYRLSGIGLRQVIDLWVMHRTYPNMDYAKIESELEKLHLLDFYRNTVRTIRSWFEDGPEDEITQLLGQYIFDSGSWGSLKAKVLSRGVRYRSSDHSAKGRNAFRLVFPTLAFMEGQYPILDKHAWLLPICWVARWFAILLFRRQNISSRIQEMTIMDEQNLSDFEKNMVAVGLYYHFED